MPKTRKTKKQKVKTTERKVVSVKTVDINIPKTKTTKVPERKQEDILVVPSKFIVADLRKTITLSVIFTVITLGMYAYQQKIFDLLLPLF